MIVQYLWVYTSGANSGASFTGSVLDISTILSEETKKLLQETKETNTLAYFSVTKKRVM
jgi:hypothetical protein